MMNQVQYGSNKLFLATEDDILKFSLSNGIVVLRDEKISNGWISMKYIINNKNEIIIIN